MMYTHGVAENRMCQANRGFGGSDPERYLR